MNAHLNVQIINGTDGTPAFVVVPYAEWKRDKDQRGVPHEVVNLVYDNDWTLPYRPGVNVLH